ncbi:MAG: helix-turn-helix domain-containing protein [Paludibacter sp.]|mgnify:FL=1|jgi:transcriptional regulator with XRE-family HTH domain|nr:cupin domain-containing protein [Bacteroidales bacterium]HOG06067.1 cupin domain-containing protein [Paludibacter sp.]
MSNNIIGKKITTLCTDKNISLEGLAELSGLKKEQIQIILDSDNIPSLAPLIKIARALGVRLGTFLDDSTALGPVVYRKTENIDPVTFSSQLSSANSHLDFTALASKKSGRAMEPFLITVTTDRNQKPVLSSHEGEEFIYVLEGSIKINYGQDVYVVHAGESIYYDSIVEHLVTSNGREPARILAVVYTPL